MTDNSFFPLSFIAAPAILTAGAILQSAGLVFLPATTTRFFRKGLCGRAMLALHPPFAPGLPPERSGDHAG